MPSIIGTAFLDVRPETTNFESDLKKKISGFGGIAPVIGTLAAAGVAVGGALFDIGSKFEDAFNKIKVATGATGLQLAGLGVSFKDVFSKSASSMTDVATAISEVSVRTHLTGTALDDLSKKFVDLSRITGTSVATNVQTVTALFNNFGVATKNQSAELDVLFKAAQQSGVGIDNLVSSVQAATPTAQTLGLNINQTTALVAQLTQAGLPATKVMMGLGMEFAKAAKAGQDPTSVIAKLVAEIKAAPNATDAATLAVRNFGVSARQAATLVDAVRAGTLNFGATLASITSGGGGIEAATNATLTLGDKFKILRNTALTALEPIAMKVVDFANLLADRIPGAIRTTVDVIKGAIGGLVGGFSGQALAASGFVRVFGEIGRTARDIFDFIRAHKAEVLGALAGIGAIVLSAVIPAFVGWAAAAGAAAAATIAAAAPFIAASAAAAAVGYGLVYAYTHFVIFRDIVKDVAKVIVDVAVFAFRQVRLEIETVVAVFTDLIKFFSDVFQGKWSAAFKALEDIPKRLFEYVRDTVGNIVKLFESLPAQVLGGIESLGGAIGRFFEGLPADAVTGLKTLGSALLTAFKNGIVALVTGLPGLLIDVAVFFEVKLPLLILEWTANAAVWLAGVGVKLIVGFVSDLISALPTVAKFFLDLPGEILTFIGNAALWLVHVGMDILTGLCNGLIATVPALFRFFTGLPSKILDLLKDAGTWLVKVGQAIIDGLIKGIGNEAGKLESKVKDSILGPIKKIPIVGGLIGSPSPYFTTVGEAIVQGLALGIANKANLPQQALAGVKIGGPTVAPVGLGTPSAIAAAGPTAATTATTTALATQTKATMTTNDILKEILAFIREQALTANAAVTQNTQALKASTTESILALRAEQVQRGR